LLTVNPFCWRSNNLATAAAGKQQFILERRLHFSLQYGYEKCEQSFFKNRIILTVNEKWFVFAVAQLNVITLWEKNPCT
jgi:hypothetical protein